MRINFIQNVPNDSILDINHKHFMKNNKPSYCNCIKNHCNISIWEGS